MQLWFYWWEIVSLLRPPCSQHRTFLWFAVSVLGLSVRTDNLGVTTIVRAVGLDGKYYYNLLDCFHSASIKLSSSIY
jgi:hypothetical protein